MLAADPVVIGAVYTEEDLGSDQNGDTFEITFQGGAPNTQLTRIVIDGNQDGDPSALTLGEMYFDTAAGGRGADNHIPFAFDPVRSEGIVASDVEVHVADGETRLELLLTNFEAGDRLVFSIDVDEVERRSDDPIASGAEFETSLFEARFTAPHYHDVVQQDEFINAYDFTSYPLDLPVDNHNNLADRTDGALIMVQQQPLPITIAGTVFHDRNVNLLQEAGDEGIADVRLALWQQDAAGVYVDTGLTALTNTQGDYIFGPELNLMPGHYRVSETQPAGFPISVGAIPGMIQPGDGTIVGSTPDTNTLTDIHVPLGGLHAVDYDFAEARPARISGHVYHDRNDNGSRETTEEGIADVLVDLIDDTGRVVDSQFTDDNGLYAFETVAPGTYSIRENHPDDWIDGQDRAGTIDRAGIGRVTVGTAANDIIRQVTIFSEEQGVDYDFGERLGSLSGTVHVDDDGDCLRDPDELSLAGVTIRLLDDTGRVIDTRKTDVNGRYSFTELHVGTYSVQQVQPTDYFHAGQTVGTGVGDASSANIISSIRIDNNHVNLTDYSFCEALGSLSGFVYHDRDNDGNREPGSGESGIGGVTLRLLDTSGNAVLDSTGNPRTAVTNGDGYYEFTDLAPGRYRIIEEHPSAWVDGLDTPGSVGGVASNPGDVIDQIDLTAIAPDQSALHGINYNFGELRGSISGRVHVDSDGDCVFDPGETPLSGVEITLTDQDGNVWTQFTDDDGRYSFDDLPSGTYTLRETQPDDYFNGGQSVGNGGGNGSTENVISGIELGGERVELDGYDFCEELGSLSGFVYHDRDNNGLRESDTEEPIADVVIELRDASGQPVVDSAGNPRTTVTNADGYYEFTDVSPGTYRLVERHPIDWVDGLDTPGTVDGVPVGLVVNPGDELLQIRLADGATHGENYNFGERRGSLQGVVHVDPNGNCEFDPGETGIEGVTIRLIDQDGVTRTTRTDINGRYRFDDLPAGEYTIIETQPTDYFSSGERVGVDGFGRPGPGGVSTPNEISGVRIDSGVTSLTDYNFCEDFGTIQGFVYHDRNNNGEKEPGETGISGVIVTLTDLGGTTIQTVETGIDGSYEFTHLGPGVYHVVETHPTDWIDGLDTPGTVDGVPTGFAQNPGDRLSFVDLTSFSPGTSPRHGVDYNFGELLTSRISGVVHSDPNRNCEFEDGEDPIEGVTVELLNEAGDVVQTTKTGANGAYVFDDVAPGTYTVRESQPDGYFHFSQRAGSHGGDASRNDLISAIEIESGQTLTDYNFCELPPATISGYVFQDGPAIRTVDGNPPLDVSTVRDGQRTADDIPLEGVLLRLRFGLTGEDVPVDFTLDGTYRDGVVQVYTDASGYYEFTGLLPDVYHVYEVQPEGYFDGLDTPGPLGGQAVNVVPGEDIPIFVASLPQTNNDAIVRIGINSGQHAESNNFSEIVVERDPVFPPPQPPETPPQIPPPVAEAPPVAAAAPMILPPVTPIRPTDYYHPGGHYDYTWHLSVVNAGAPRGHEEFVSLSDTQFGFTTYLQQTNWSPNKLAAAQWTLYSVLGSETSQTRPADQHTFGLPEGIPVTGDFDGDGLDEIAIFVHGEWFIDLNGNGIWDQSDLWAKLGDEDDLPVTGDWDGDGKDDIGIFGPAWSGDARAIEAEPGLPDPQNRPKDRPKNIPPTPEEATDGHRYLQHTQSGSPRADLIDHVFHYGAGLDRPVAGDWNGDGISSIGVFREGQWILDTDGDGRLSAEDLIADFGELGDIPIVGDFNNDGIDEIGTYRNGKWTIDSNNNREFDAHDQVFELGSSEDQPVVGDWDGDGTIEPGLYRDLDTPEDRQADASEDDEGPSLR